MAFATTETGARTIIRRTTGIVTSDGAGVTLMRLIGTPDLPDFDPFLMLDAFGSDDPDGYIAGFPDHPHRGFETVTYMLAGRMRHRDSRGNEGLLEAGSLQWMTAASGLVHSEMPEQTEGLMSGFQLWINLPAADKMKTPRYQDMTPGLLPIVEDDGISMKVLAGQYRDVSSPVETGATEPLYLDVTIKKKTSFTLDLPQGHAAFLYCHGGALEVDGPHGEQAEPLANGEIGLLSNGSSLSVTATQEPARFLLVVAKPLNEPVARRGPFVMNTQVELEQAFADYRSGKLSAAA